MPYQVKLHRYVVRELASMQPGLRSGIVERLGALEQDPSPRWLVLTYSG